MIATNVTGILCCRLKTVADIAVFGTLDSNFDFGFCIATSVYADSSKLMILPLQSNTTSIGLEGELHSRLILMALDKAKYLVKQLSQDTLLQTN